MSASRTYIDNNKYDILDNKSMNMIYKIVQIVVVAVAVVVEVVFFVGFIDLEFEQRILI